MRRNPFPPKMVASSIQVEKHMINYAFPFDKALNVKDVPLKYPVKANDIDMYVYRYLIPEAIKIAKTICNLNDDKESIQRFWMNTINNGKLPNVRGGIDRRYADEVYVLSDDYTHIQAKMVFDLVVEIFVPIREDEGFWVDIISPKVSKSYNSDTNMYSHIGGYMSSLYINKDIPIDGELEVQTPIAVMNGEFSKVIEGLKHSMAYTGSQLEERIAGENEFCSISRNGWMEFIISFDKLKEVSSPFKDKLLSSLYITKEKEEEFLKQFCFMAKKTVSCFSDLYKYHPQKEEENNSEKSKWVMIWDEYDETVFGGHID